MFEFRKSIRGFARNDSAQALAEAVIVIPVIFFVFMLMLQYFAIIQASQIGNYAAYCACRVYAVQVSVDPTNALEKATTAACMAYAPVSRLAPRELGMPAGSPSSYLPGGTPETLGNVAALAEGYVVARYIRLNSIVSGGNVNMTTSDSPGRVSFNLNYAQPIFIPGLPELWRLIGGEQDIFKALEPMSEGLSSSSGYGYAKKFGLAEKFFKYPYVCVSSKCTMGCEDWGSDAEKFRPRKRKTVEDKEVSNPKLEENARKQQDALEECNKANEKVAEARKELEEAQAAVDKAQQEYDNVMADPKSSDSRKSAASEKLRKATEERDRKLAAYDRAVDEYNEKKAKLDELSTGPSD